MTAETLVPPHLRKFVVRQDYDAYTEQDHAVWRFVVMQTHARLLSTAHEAYRSGFARTGITLDRIPRISDVSERLAEFGWCAVAVDGFIPPRAFQAFQARGILPIAADVRSANHLTYTPAPDIIHEAAGHAPFLADPDYARYLRRIGRAAERAFSGPPDRELYLAIHALSEVKEDPASTGPQIADAECAVRLAVERSATHPASESTKLSRLYWWTAEYGLTGTPTDFRLYGAGLLSSIGEGHFCREFTVRKLPLTAECAKLDYDITRAQPQLFVAKDFSVLEGVLEDVTRTFAYEQGGDHALDMALESGEVATLELDSGAEVAGVVRTVHRVGGEPIWIELSGDCAVAQAGVVLSDAPRTTGYALPLGALSDGTPLSALSDSVLRRNSDDQGNFVLRLASGLLLRGRAHPRARACDPSFLVVDDFELARNGQVLFRREQLYPLALGHHVRTASAALPDGFLPETPESGITVPRARQFGSRDRELVRLYERAMDAWRDLGGHGVESEFRQIIRHLEERFPEDWLLRWNVLESLVKIGEQSTLTRKLEADLERLEVHFDHLEPIATGLSYIRTLMGRSAEIRKKGRYEARNSR